MPNEEALQRELEVIKTTVLNLQSLDDKKAQERIVGYLYSMFCKEEDEDGIGFKTIAQASEDTKDEKDDDDSEEESESLSINAQRRST